MFENIKNGDVFDSKSCGKFILIDKRTSKSSTIKFIDTGFETDTQYVYIKSGSIRDPYHRNIFGIGYFGVGKYSSGNSTKVNVSYQKWKDMFIRCYSEKCRKRYPTYKDCTVCEEWHNYQNFAKWFEENYIEGYHLDKDELQEGIKNKIYSPETCKFISPNDNILLANKNKFVSFKLKSPDGVIHKGENVSGFAKKHNLTPTHIHKVVKGKLKSHKGWTKA